MVKRRGRRPEGEQQQLQIPGVVNGHVENRILEPEVHTAIRHWAELFEQRFGVPPVVNGGKDGAQIKRLIKSHGLETVVRLIDRMFASHDPFVLRSDYGIGTLCGCANKLLIEERRGGIVLSDRTARNLAALDAFIRGSEIATDTSSGQVERDADDL